MDDHALRIADNCSRKKHYPLNHKRDAIADARRLRGTFKTGLEVYLCPACRNGWLLGNSLPKRRHHVARIVAGNRAAREREIRASLRTYLGPVPEELAK